MDIIFCTYLILRIYFVMESTKIGNETVNVCSYCDPCPEREAYDVVKCHSEKCKRYLCKEHCANTCGRCGVVFCEEHGIVCEEQVSENCTKGICEKCDEEENKWSFLTCCDGKYSCVECKKMHPVETCNRCLEVGCGREMLHCEQKHYFCDECAQREIKTFIGQNDLYIVSVFDVCEWCLRKDVEHANEACDMCRTEGDELLCMGCNTIICDHLADACFRKHRYCVECYGTQVLALVQQGNGISYGVCARCLWDRKA